MKSFPQFCKVESLERYLVRGESGEYMHMRGEVHHEVSPMVLEEEDLAHNLGARSAQG